MAQTYTQNLNIPKMNLETPLLHTQIDNALERIDVAALPVTHAGSKMHWPMWEKEKVYQKQDVFRTETIPSWGYWEVTKAGTSGTVAPIGSGEGDTVTNGTCVLILRRLTKYAGGGGGGSGGNYKQITKQNVTATTSNPVNVLCPLGGNSADLCLPTPNVLKYIPGATTLNTLCAFNNGDADDFAFDSRYVEFKNGYMQLVTEYTEAMSTPAALESGYLSVSGMIDLTAFKTVESLEVATV